MIKKWFSQVVFFLMDLWDRHKPRGYLYYIGLPWGLRWWRVYLQCRRLGFDPWVRKIPWGREWQPMPGFWHIYVCVCTVSSFIYIYIYTHTHTYICILLNIDQKKSKQFKGKLKWRYMIDRTINKVNLKDSQITGKNNKN